MVYSVYLLHVVTFLCRGCMCCIRCMFGVLCGFVVCGVVCNMLSSCVYVLCLS